MHHVDESGWTASFVNWTNWIICRGRWLHSDEQRMHKIFPAGDAYTRIYVCASLRYSYSSILFYCSAFWLQICSRLNRILHIDVVFVKLWSIMWWDWRGQCLSTSFTSIQCERKMWTIKLWFSGVRCGAKCLHVTHSNVVCRSSVDVVRGKLITFTASNVYRPESRREWKMLSC